MELGAKGREEEVIERERGPSTRQMGGPYLRRDGAGRSGRRNHLAEKSKKRKAIRKLEGPGVESGYLERD